MPLITSNQIRVAGVCERDIDLILLDEFASSPDFCRWFFCCINLTNPLPAIVTHLHRSATESNGESDLEISVRTADGKDIRLLLENKISASFQPRQAARYRERGQGYITQGKCKAFQTILVAPQLYIGTEGDLNGFDSVVSYEDMRDYFSQSGDLRSAYRVSIFSKAIEKATRGWQLIEDLPASQFWRRYWELVCKHAVQLELPEPAGKPSGSCFIRFRPPELPPEIHLVHKFAYGNVDLQFSGMGNRLQTLRAALGQHMPAEWRIMKAAKSGVVRVTVPRIAMSGNLDDLHDSMMAGIQAAQSLLRWYLALPDNVRADIPGT